MLPKMVRYLLFMGEGQHKIKRKAEQIACNEAIQFIQENNGKIDVVPITNRIPKLAIISCRINIKAQIYSI